MRFGSRAASLNRLMIDLNLEALSSIFEAHVILGRLPFSFSSLSFNSFRQMAMNMMWVRVDFLLLLFSSILNSCHLFLHRSLSGKTLKSENKCVPLFPDLKSSIRFVSLEIVKLSISRFPALVIRRLTLTLLPLLVFKSPLRPNS